MRMIADGFIRDAASMGSPGIEEVRWQRPVRPGDRLTLRCTVLETRAMKSRPQWGLVRFRFEIFNQAGECVMTQTNVNMFGRRPREAAP
jgi:acyl dehydratase